MKRINFIAVGSHKARSFPALATLALWQMRQVWRLFGFIALGMVGAVILVGTVPFFAQVNTTSSMRSVFTNTGYDPASSVQMPIQIASSTVISQTVRQLKQDYQQYGRPFFDVPPDVVLHINKSALYQGDGTTLLTNQIMFVHGYDSSHISSLHLVQGRFPQTVDDGLEVVMTEENAAALNAHINSTYVIYATSTTTTSPPADIAFPVTLKVVGIVKNLSPTAITDPFWHADQLNLQRPPAPEPIEESVVVSNSALLALFDHLAHEAQGQAVHFSSGAELDVYFPLDIHAITSESIGLLQGKLGYFTNVEPVQFANGVFFKYAIIDNSALLLMDATIGNQTSVLQVPVLTLLVLMLGLILFFVTVMTELLVTRQAEAMVITRSRGATTGQIFLTYVMQSLLLGLLAALVGTLLIPSVVRAIVTTLFPSTSQNALDSIPNTFLDVLHGLGWSIWIAVTLVVLTMCIAVWRTLHSSTLGRSTLQTAGVQRPLWQRLYIDALLALLGLLTYGLYTYLASTGAIDARSQVLLAGPCMLAAAALLCLAGALLFLRVFPWLLHLAAGIAARGRGLLPLFSLVMMARAPRQAMRTTLLLVFTIAFAIFAQVFLATQQQRTVDVASYVTAADVTGYLSSNRALPNGTFAQQERPYQQIPGVLSASLAFVDNEDVLNANSTSPLTVIATDPGSIGSSITWPTMDRQSNINALLAHLADQRSRLKDIRPGNILPPVPAIVSNATKDLLHLSVGQTFFLTGMAGSKQMPMIDIGEVPYLPGVPDIVRDQGILVDFDSFTSAYRVSITYGALLAPTLVWVHTRPDAASLTQVQQVLASHTFALDGIIARQAVLLGLQNDPLYLNLLSTLTLGICLTLLLAWLGCLTSAWSYVRTRLRSLVALRALGTSPAQLVLLPAGEQAIMYIIAIVLGIACGAGFTAFALPNVVFSSTAQLSSISSAFANIIFQMQSTPPLRLVLPPTLWFGLAVVALLCVTAVGITAMMIARLSPARMLRLSEDYVEEAPLPPEQQKQERQALASRGNQQRWRSLAREMELGRTLTPLRRSWSTLGLTQLGVLVAILFICVVPLFSQVATTAGLHDVLTLPANRYVTVTNNATDNVPAGRVQAAMTQATGSLNRAILGQAAPYFHDAPIIALSNGRLAPDRSLPVTPSSQTSLSFAGLSAHALAAQVQLLQGHVAQPAPGGALQIMLTPPAASYLKVGVGDMLTRANGYPLDMQVVGIFQPRGGADAVLPTNFFYYSQPDNHSSGVVMVLACTEGLMQAVDTVADPSSPATSFVFTGNITWSYPLTQTVTSNQLDDLVATLSSLHVEHTGVQADAFTFAPLSTPVDVLKQYQQSVVISNVPIVCTSVLIIALLLLFLSFMVDLLVEREAGAIAVLRSRGATHRQIFMAFLKRTLIINGIGMLAGMLLAIPVAVVLTRLTLQAGDQSGLSLLMEQPLPPLLSLLGFALASSVVTLLAMGLALVQAIQTDHLSLRKEAARATRKPFWQRWYLDIVGIVIALTAYGYSLYLTNIASLDPTVHVLVRAPLVLTATICLVLACTLFLLRLFPLLLLLGAKLAMRNRGVEPMLALAQMARAPRQRLRTASLLMLTTAFVVFVVVFAASQQQHISDVARYWAGADFSGTFPTAFTADQAEQVQRAYLQVKGVEAVALGNKDTLQDGTTNLAVKVLAVDLKNFMRTVDWPELNTAQRQMLVDELSDPSKIPALAPAWLASTDEIPAVIDRQTAQEFQVGPDESFTIGVATFFVVAEVDTIPTVNDLSQQTQDASGGNGGAASGILVDYVSYSLYFYQSQFFQPTYAPINYIWLKTDGSTRSVQSVRQVLASGPLHLAAFYDRQASAQVLDHDPLNLNLIGILVLGALAPLLLVWIGCLMASWIDVRQRQLLFGILRALGSTPQQLAKVLAWEQALIFGTAVVMGTLFGLLTAFLALPSLVLTSVLPRLSTAVTGSLASSVQDLFSLQGAPSVHPVIPLVLAAVVFAVALLATLGVLIMTRSAARLSLSQVLRLNED